MKLGASLGTEGGYLRSVGESARASETLGFAGLWTSETKHDAFGREVTALEVALSR